MIESSASVLVASDQRDDAERFVDYLLGPQAQAYFAEETLEYPLVSGVEPAADLPPLDELEAPDVDVDALGEGFAATQELLDASGLDG